MAVVEIQGTNGVLRPRLTPDLQAFLRYNQLEEYLLFLTKKRLLRYNKNTRTFRITEKGLEFLKMYNHIVDMIEYEHKKKENSNEPIESGKEKVM